MDSKNKIRKPFNINLDVKVIEDLKKHSKKTLIPASRIIEELIKKELRKGDE